MRTTPVQSGLLALGVLVTLVGCTATPVPRATPTSTAEFTPLVFSGTFDSGKSFTVPAGARSATITVVCSGEGSFNLDGALNKDEGGLTGMCSTGGHRYHLPVVTGQTLDLEIELSKPEMFVIEARFSREPFVVDSELARQCSALDTVGSDAINAEEGFTLRALSLEQWQQKVSDASHALEPVLTDKPNILSAQLKTMSDALGTSGTAPGAFTGPSDYASAMSIARQVCSDNGDALYVVADYGG